MLIAELGQSEHHELVLARARQTADDVGLIQQEVTHGSAFALHVWELEGNRIEVHHRVQIEVRQPLHKDLNRDQPLPDVLAEAERLLTEGGPAYTGAVGGGRPETAGSR